MSRALTSRTTLDSLKKEAKRWLKALHANDADALARLRAVYPAAPADPGLRDIQRAIALEHGLEGWTILKHKLSAMETAGGSDARDAALKALLEAAVKGDVTRVAQALDEYPDILDQRRILPGHSGLRTALHHAVSGPHEAVVACLLERGADPNIRCEGDFAFPLHFAAEKQHLGIIRLLIEHGADPIGDGDYHELQVIGWATCFDYLKVNTEVVDYLVAHGARHTIFSAVAMGEAEIVRELAAQSPGDLNRRMDLTNQRRMPLHLAVVKKQLASLVTLLDLGANTEGLDEAALTPLDQAALAGEKEMARLLIEHGAEVRLPAAVALGRTRDVERLVRRDPDCLKPGNQWGTLIVRAAERSGGDVIESLIRLGASVDAFDGPKTAIDNTSRFTPLHGAAWHGNMEAAAVLLKHGANPAIRDERYCGTPAGWANYAGHAGIRDLILEGAIDVFEVIDFDLTRRLPEILTRDPGALDRPFGSYVTGRPRPDQWWPDAECTPLMWAVLKNKVDAARTLLRHGADVGARDARGRSLVDIARQDGREEMLRVLLGE